MRKLCELVAVTYGEFQSWYNYGELRLSADRIVYLEASPDGVPDSESPHAAVLMERLPQLSLEDEEGVLIVQLSPLGAVTYGEQLMPALDARTLFLPLARVIGVIPLTERARRILEPRLQPLGVSLKGAYFEQQKQEAWFRRGVRRALNGGDALVGVLFSNRRRVIGNALQQAVEGGIWALDHKDDQSAEGLSSAGAPGPTWVPDAFTFTRYKPYTKDNRDLDYVLDAGVALKALVDRQKKEDGLLEPFRESIKNIFLDKFGPAVRLPEILGDESFKEIAEQTKAGLPVAFPADLGTLALFLYWKDAFHKSKEEIDYLLMSRELPGFVSALGFDETVAAVWLLGCFVGYEGIAPAVYSSDRDAFAWYSGTALKIDKIGRPSPEIPMEPKAQTPDTLGTQAEQSGAEPETPMAAAEPAEETRSEISVETGMSEESEGEAKQDAAPEGQIVNQEPSASEDRSQAASKEQEPSTEDKTSGTSESETAVELRSGKGQTTSPKSKTGRKSKIQRDERMQLDEGFALTSPTGGGVDQGANEMAAAPTPNAAAASEEAKPGNRSEDSV